MADLLKRGVARVVAELAPALELPPRDREEEAFVRRCGVYTDGIYRAGALRLYELTDVFLHPGTGLVLLPDGSAPAESLQYESRLSGLARKGIWCGPPKANRLLESACSISLPLHTNYFHWMIDCLPRLRALCEYAEETRPPVVYPSTLPAKHRELLGALLPAGVESLEVEPREWLRVGKLAVPGYGTGKHAGYLREPYCEFLRQGLERAFEVPAIAPARRLIYVSRRSARARSIRNESALEAALARRGFEPVALENLSLKEQAHLFRSARAVVAPHGAGLANLIYCQPGTTVLEIMPSTCFRGHFYFLARSLGLDYRFAEMHSDRYAEKCRADIGAVERAVVEMLG